MRRRPLVFLLLVGIVFLWAAGSTAAPSNPALEGQVQQIARQLRCPVCQNLSVLDSPSGMAAEMRTTIREMLQQGKTPAQIKAFFVSKYGEWVLLAPPEKGLNLVVWFLPFVAGGLGLLGVLWVLGRWVRRSKSERASGPVDPTYLARVQKEVSEFDSIDRRVESEEDSSPEAARLRSLNGEKASLYEAIQELEFDFQAGKLSAADYGDLRRYYEERAARILQEIDHTPKKAPAASRRSAKTKSKRAPAQPARAAAASGAPQGAKMRTSYLLVGGAALLGFGLALGIVLTRTVQPRTEGGAITGGFLTGTPQSQNLTPGEPGPLVPALKDSGSGPISPQVLSGMLDAARKSISDGQYGQAISAYEAILKRDPKNTEAITYMGYIAALAGHADVAVQAYDKALKLDPKYAAALYYKGVTLEQQKQDHRGAIKAWEKFLKVIPTGEDAVRVRGWIAQAKQKASGSKKKP